jgi:hypothetical protein
MTHSDQKRRRGSVAIPVIVAGGISSVLLAFSMTPTFSALAASIQNSANTAGTGTLVMEEQNADGTITCTSTDTSVSSNSATCASINKYGGSMSMVPGAKVSTDITIKNTGTAPASSFTVVGGTCTQSDNGTVNGSASDLCSKLHVVIKSGTTTIVSDTAAAFAGTSTDILAKLSSTGVAAQASIPLNITVTLDSSAGNSYQGLKASQPITWSFGA